MTSPPAVPADPWSRRFLDLIESSGRPGALRGGRRLARSGLVLHHHRSGNIIVANVRDPEENADDPVWNVQRVRIVARAFDSGQWERIAAAVARRTSTAALLLAGRVPGEIGHVLAALGLTLLPEGAGELAMTCTCQDWQVPCVHTAAACYLVADEFDADVFELLGWRGMERRLLLDRVRELRVRAAMAAGEGDTGAGEAQQALPADPSAFWSATGRRPAAMAKTSASASMRPDALMDICGPLPVGRLGDLADILRAAYFSFAEDASQTATAARDSRRQGQPADGS